MNTVTDLINKLPDSMKEQARLKFFGMVDVPMIGYCKPQLIQLDQNICQIKFPLNRRTKNHLNCMYFGALSCGADITGGLAAMKVINESGENVSLVFKDFKADFLKRAEADTVFTCKDGAKVRELVKRAIATKERVNELVEVVATCPSKLGEEPVAKFELTLSLKVRSPK